MTQPRLGLVGLLFTAAVFVPLTFGTGRAESSLRIFGPLATFALPVVAMIAFWWRDWPGTRFRAPWAGLVDTGLVVAGAVLLTVAGEAVVARVDVAAIFDTRLGPGPSMTFPATLPLGGAVFAAMLELTFVSEGWPLRRSRDRLPDQSAGPSGDRLGELWAGLTALAVSWAAAVAAYELLVNTDSVPAGIRAETGLRNPGGPIAVADFGGALIAVAVWQALFFVALRGWPFTGYSRRAIRLLVGNAVVIGAGAATYVGLHTVGGWEPGRVSAVCGCVVASVLVVALLFEGWPASRAAPGSARLLTLAFIGAVAILVYGALSTSAGRVDWVGVTGDEWVANATLGFLGTGIILHVAIGRRWPAAPAETETLDTR